MKRYEKNSLKKYILIEERKNLSLFLDTIDLC
jgi:hypothetical protein